MALTLAQKDAIHYAAVNGTSTGSELAKKYGISASAVSLLKNHYTPSTPGKVKTDKVANTISTTPKVEEVKTSKKVVETFQVCVSSSKSNAVEFTLPVGATFGDLMALADERGALEGVFKNTKSGEKSRVKNLKDVINAEANSVYNVYLLPLKSSSGK